MQNQITLPFGKIFKTYKKNWEVTEHLVMLTWVEGALCEPQFLFLFDFRPFNGV